MKKDGGYYLAIFIIVLAYLASCVYYDVSDLSKIITTVTALIAAVALWLEFKRDKRLNEAKFLMELNDQFIGNKEMTNVEQALECYFNCANDENRVEPLCLNLDIDVGGKDRQALINYLVHLEGIAALVESGVIQINKMDNLFAYRFFIAVNNPEVQEHELVKYCEYYEGIFWLYNQWSVRWRKNSKHIPLQNYSLSEAMKRMGK